MKTYTDFNKINDHLNNTLEGLGNPHLISVEEGCETIKTVIESELTKLGVDFTFVPEHSYVDLNTYNIGRPVTYIKYGEVPNYSTKNQRKYQMVLHYILKDYELYPLFIKMFCCKIHDKLVYDLMFSRTHNLCDKTYDHDHLKNYNYDYEFVNSKNYSTTIKK